MHILRQPQKERERERDRDTQGRGGRSWPRMPGRHHGKSRLPAHCHQAAAARPGRRWGWVLSSPHPQYGGFASWKEGEGRGVGRCAADPAPKDGSLLCVCGGGARGRGAASPSSEYVPSPPLNGGLAWLMIAPAARRWRQRRRSPPLYATYPEGVARQAEDRLFFSQRVGRRAHHATVAPGPGLPHSPLVSAGEEQ